MPHYIYALEDPSTHRVHYVGRTVSPEVRLKTHIINSRDRGATKVTAWISRLVEHGLKPEMRILEKVDTEQEAKGREQHWIDEFRSNGAKLVNSRAAKAEDLAPHWHTHGRFRRHFTNARHKERRPQFLLRFPDEASKAGAEEWAERAGFPSLTDYVLEAISTFNQFWAEKAK